MINKAECYALALQEIKTARHVALEKADALRVELLGTHPELARLEKELISLSQKKMQATLHAPETLPALQKEYEKLKESQKTYLEAIGLNETAFEPTFLCALCQDTGTTANGTCECVKKRTNEKMLEQLCDQFPIQDFSFESFSFEYYEGDELKKIKEIFNACKYYAETFSKKSKSLYLLGETGLGKTHLTFAMAKEIVKKGYSVIYCTAQTMISALEKEHFGKTDEPLQEYYLNCDLLILDDLGTEYLSNVAQSELYNVINHRILLNLPTIINSNLSPTQLEERYGQRLVSRICGCYQSLHFYGDDIRIKKLKKRVASKKLKKFENI